MQRVRVGIIGIGDRGVSFVHNFRQFQDLAEVAGILAHNRLRAEAAFTFSRSMRPSCGTPV